MSSLSLSPSKLLSLSLSLRFFLLQFSLFFLIPRFSRFTDWKICNPSRISLAYPFFFFFFKRSASEPSVSPTTTEGAVHWKQKRPRCEEQAALRVVRPWRPVCLLVQRVIVVAHCGVRFPLSSLTALLVVRCPVKEESTPLRISHVHEASKSARALAAL